MSCGGAGGAGTSSVSHHAVPGRIFGGLSSRPERPSIVTQANDRLSVALADRYRIERELGAGGMATVYLAQDLKHDRLVAVKVLKPELAAVLGAERFVVEIKTTASMSHPHILPLFDSGAADGFLFYVMPYIDGETLRSRLDRETQLGIDESVRIAREVLDALEYAHAHGVIHRDIKPENILMQGGRPMIADFGIALAVSAAAGGRMTETGLSLGTPHYMSPEQATAEKEITGRADIYSLASVLYEMLTGEPPHMGNSAQQIIMKIITEPAAAVTKFRKSVPANVADAVAKALEKLPADRFASAREFSEALGNSAFTLVTSTGGVGTTRSSGRWRERAALPLAAGLALALIAAAWGWSRSAPSTQTIRVPIELPDSAMLLRQPGILFALSADGSRLVYVGPGEGDVDLWERPMNALASTRIPETNGADSPFLSPGGDVVGFYRSNPPRVFSASLRGGPRQTWAVDSTIALGGDFGRDGSIYFVRSGGVRHAREAGGPVERVTQVDTAAGERVHAWVDVLPREKAAIFTIVRSRETENDIAAVDFRTGKVKVLVRGIFARFSSPGHLVYVDATGGLFAIAFDESSLTTRGAPIPLVAGVGHGERGVAHMTLSESGALLYSVGSGGGDEEIVWVDRNGRASPIDSTLDGSIEEVALSPDGRRLAFGRGDGAASNIWIKDLPNGPLQKLTLDGENYTPSWSADGRTVFFLSQRDGRPDALYQRRVDGSTNATFVLGHATDVQNAVVSRDGEWIVYSAAFDIFARRTTGDTAVMRIVGSPATEISPALSPDGRWLAYVSNESGTPEIYVSPFPAAATSRTIVSLGGGRDPRWSANGRELFYVSAATARDVVAAQVDLSPSFRVRDRIALFDRREFTGETFGGAYSVTPDGQRFVMYRPHSSQKPRLVLSLNWSAELDGKVVR